MECFIKWIFNNKEWLFSGVAGSIVISFIAWLFKKKPSAIIINNNGVSAADVITIAESIFQQNFPKFQEIARVEVAKNKALFIDDLQKNILAKLDPGLYQRFEDPDIQYALLEALRITARKQNAQKREILSNLIIERVKRDGIDLDEIIYLEAIKKIALLTSEQIKTLISLDIITSLAFDCNTKSQLNDSKIDLLVEHIKKTSPINKTNIRHLLDQNLITSTFPYEIDIKQLDTIQDEQCTGLINLCKDTYSQYSALELNKYQLTSIGKAISQTDLSTLLNINYTSTDSSGILKLSDFKANNIHATGDVTAYAAITARAVGKN